MPRRRLSEIPYSLDFNNQIVNLGNLADFFETTGDDFSLSIDAKTVSTSFDSLLGVVGVGNRRWSINFNRTGQAYGHIELFLRDNTGGQIWKEWTMDWLNGQWQNLIFVKSANNSAGIELYLNGTQISKEDETDANVFTPDADANGFALGASNTGKARTFTGSLTKLVIWKRALTSTEITDIAFNRLYPANPHVAYGFTDGAGTTLTDSEGRQDGTIDSADQWNSASPSKERTSA